MKSRSNLLLYLLLNILVSAVTTVAVLWVWDNTHRNDAPNTGAQNSPVEAIGAPQVQAQNTENPVLRQAATLYAEGTRAAESTKGALAASGTTVPTLTAAPTLPVETSQPIETLPPAGQPVIQMVSVVGAGDLEQEVVLLKRVGEGNLNMAGWELRGEHNNTYTFPNQPELILYKDGAVQVYTKAGTDTVTEVYWNRSAAAWRSGELIRLLDPQGVERASYKVP